MPNENGLTRLDRIERAIENLSTELQVQRVNFESLHSSVSELHGIAQEQGRAIDKLLAATPQDAENIRALARIAEMHERRLTNLEGGESQ